MIKLGRTAIISIIALAAYPLSPQEKLSKQEREAMALTPAQVAQMVEVRGASDQLEPTIWVTTEPFLKKRFSDDKFLRANIDKATGTTFFQLYLSGSARDWLRLSRMTYLIDGRLQTAKVERVFFDVSCYRYACTHYEDYVVTIPRDHLDVLAVGQDGPVWRARLFGDSVQGVDVTVLRNETAGLLLAVDQTLASSGVGQATKGQ